MCFLVKEKYYNMNKINPTVVSKQPSLLKGG